MKILLTGASGFVGRGLLPELLKNGHEVVLAVRKPLSEYTDVSQVVIPHMNADTVWGKALHGCDRVIHAAAHAGTGVKSSGQEIERLFDINTHATISLAKQAANAGVSRLIFISSIKVHGDTSPPGEKLTVCSAEAPSGHYGQSKLAAERGLEQVSQNSSLETVIIRPPLVYGPGVSANFEVLVKLVAKGVPLPFGSALNRRSFVARDNLVDFINTCLSHPGAANQKFLVSDNDDKTMKDWFKAIAGSMNKTARLIPFPPGVLIALCRLFRKPVLASSVLGSLELDIESSERILDWRPAVSVEQALQATSEAFLNSAR